MSSMFIYNNPFARITQRTSVALRHLLRMKQPRKASIMRPVTSVLSTCILISSILTFSGAAWAACTSGLPATTPTNRFVVDSTDQGVVLDRKTGLRWMRCSVGMTYNAGSCTGSAVTYTYDGAQAAAVTAGGTWRVPNVKELSSIVERRCTSPSINTAVFPDGIASWYWTSSPSVGNSNYAWYVYFYNGSVYDNYGRNYGKYVRLVR